jgi:hypothetical protein
MRRLPLLANAPQERLASYAGIMQADAFAGFNPLYDRTRRPAPIIGADPVSVDFCTGTLRRLLQ